LNLSTSRNFVKPSDWISVEEVSGRYLEYLNLQFEILDGLNGFDTSVPLTSYYIDRLKFAYTDPRLKYAESKIPTELLLFSVAHCFK